MAKFVVLLAVGIFFQVAQARATVQVFNLKDNNGNPVKVTLTDYEMSKAVISEYGNLCGPGVGDTKDQNMVAAWSINDSTLELDGKSYVIENDCFYGTLDARYVGLMGRFYFHTFTLKDHATCLKDFSFATHVVPSNYVGPMKEADLIDMHVAFRDPSANQTDVVLYVNYQDKKVIVFKRKPGKDPFFFMAWDVAASGPLTR